MKVRWMQSTLLLIKTLLPVCLFLSLSLSLSLFLSLDHSVYSCVFLLLPSTAPNAIVVQSPQLPHHTGCNLPSTLFLFYFYLSHTHTHTHAHTHCTHQCFSSLFFISPSDFQKPSKRTECFSVQPCATRENQPQSRQQSALERDTESGDC